MPSRQMEQVVEVVGTEQVVGFIVGTGLVLGLALGSSVGTLDSK